MPQFKIQRTDGGQDIVTANRVENDGDRMVFHGPGAPDRIVHQAATADIASLRRRIVEPSGTARWITERPAEPRAQERS